VALLSTDMELVLVSPSQAQVHNTSVPM